MKKLSLPVFSITLCVSFLLAVFVRPASAQPASAQDEIVTTNDALCVPGVDQMESLNCLNAGPAKQVNDYAAIGLTFPEEAVSMVHPPLDLFNIPFSYAEVDQGSVNLYASVEDAIADKPDSILPAGRIKYVSLTQKQVTDYGTFYQIATGKWINGANIKKASIPYFQGYLIKQNPTTPFGWVLTNDAVSHSSPDYNAPVNDKKYTRMQLIHKYGEETVNGTDWIMIGPNEWMEHRFLGFVYNNPTAPAGVTNNRWIEVNLYEQVLTVYDQGEMVFATLISSGVEPFYTKPGTFTIYKKVEHEYMTGAFEADRSDYYYLEEVPFIMYYDESRALHGAYWNTFYGYQRSHGCVNLSVGDAHWLYDWANEGDTVYVWDPSGLTPTDPSAYTQGGA